MFTVYIISIYSYVVISIGNLIVLVHVIDIFFLAIVVITNLIVVIFVSAFITLFF